MSSNLLTLNILMLIKSHLVSVSIKTVAHSLFPS